MEAAREAKGKPGARRKSVVLLRGTPNFGEQIVECRVVFFEFGADKGIEVVSVKEGFGAFGKVFVRVVQAVVADRFTGVKQDFLVELSVLGSLKSRKDFCVVKAEKLIVIGVGEFVQNHGWVFKHF